LRGRLEEGEQESSWARERLKVTSRRVRTPIYIRGIVLLIAVAATSKDARKAAARQGKGQEGSWRVKQA